MTEERRREPRLDASSLSLFVYDNLRDELLGTLVNISRSGLLMLTGTAVDPDGVLQIDLRRESSPENASLALGIQVSWITPANTEDNYWIGARIIAISDVHKAKLEALLREAEAATAS